MRMTGASTAPSPSLPATNAKRLCKGATATRQSIYPARKGGLLRFARNDVEKARHPTSDLPIAPSNGRTTPKQKPKAAVRLHGRINDQFTGRAGHCRTLRGARRAMAATDARREPPQPSIFDLGAVRGPGTEMVLWRISRARRPAFRGPCETRHQAGRICADPPEQLHRGRSGLVCLRRT